MQAAHANERERWARAAEATEEQHQAALAALRAEHAHALCVR